MIGFTKLLPTPAPLSSPSPGIELEMIIIPNISCHYSSSFILFFISEWELGWWWWRKLRIKLRRNLNRKKLVNVNGISQYTFSSILSCKIINWRRLRFFDSTKTRHIAQCITGKDNALSQFHETKINLPKAIYDEKS